MGSINVPQSTVRDPSRGLDRELGTHGDVWLATNEF
jgi:hypothetical protein